MTRDLTGKIVEIAQARRRFGYRRIHDLLRPQFPGVNHKRVYQLYSQANLAELVARICQRPRMAISPFLVQDDNGQPLTALALRSRFDKARKLAGVSFQFRNIRAKAATDTGDLTHSQKLLAHKNRDMTEHYVRSRMGERVRPLR